MPHGTARDSGPKASAALSQSAGEAGGANEEQSERAADGGGCAVQPAEGASEEVLCRVATKAEEGDAAVDAGVITTEPIDGGSSDGDATAADSGTGKGCPAGGACGAAGEHSRRSRVVALTWALEMGDIRRFASVKKAVSYCGLCGAEKSSGGKTERTPISKQRNKHLQTILVKATKLAPRWNAELALVYEREKQKGNRNRATLAVARKMVAYLMAVDREQRPFDTQLRVAGNAA